MCENCECMEGSINRTGFLKKDWSEILKTPPKLTYIDRKAKEVADSVMIDFKNGVDPFKAQQRMLHKMAKIRRRTDDKTASKISDKAAQILKQFNAGIKTND